MTLSSGDRFSGKLSLHGRNNNIGSVNVDGETISVGPVICEEDERVQLQYLGTRKAGNMSSTYAICLSNHAIDQKEYNEYLDRIIDLLTPNGPPEPGTETYVKIVEVSDDGIGYASPGGQRIGLGPVAAREGDFVQVVGVSPTHARVVRTNNSRVRTTTPAFGFSLNNTINSPSNWMMSTRAPSPNMMVRHLFVM